MNAPGASGMCSLVMFPMRKQRFAMHSGMLRELAPPVRLHKFPHTTQGILGVIVRRGQLIPVYDAGSLLVGRASTIHKFYLIVQLHPDNSGDVAAIPVDGECELVTAEVKSVVDERTYVSGLTMIGNESIPVIDLAAVFAVASAAPPSAAAESHS